MAPGIMSVIATGVHNVVSFSKHLPIDPAGHPHMPASKLKAEE
jgi:hypothetical protein